MNQPRIFVGTMYTQEGDFLECLRRIQEQEGVIVSHFIVSGLKEKEAHNALWHAWRGQQKTHDLFVKVDADTVLSTPQTLAQIWELFATNPRLTGVQAPLHDYMTDSFINGLNCFSPRVIFNDTQDELYCDRQVDTNHDVTLRDTQLPEHLRPAGLHCHYASPKQAFHYGLHRALKGQHQIIKRVEAAYESHGRDRIRAFALMGSIVAPKFVQHRHFNYQDPEFIAAFEEAQNKFEEWMQRNNS